jgi:hypothetical protein
MKYIVATILLFAVSFVYGEKPKKELPESSCAERATEVLMNNPDTIVIHINGLICGSCGVGVNFSLKKLDFVDRSRFTNGILLDAKNQFAVVALKEGHRPNRESIIQAAESAGYEAMDYYIMEGDAVRKMKL